MKLDFRSFFMEKVLILIKPEDVGMAAKDFISNYASYMQEVGIVAKEPSGYTLYPSRTAPVHEEHTQFFEELISLADALDINTVASMDFYTDGWFARDPKYQTITEKGQAMPHQICPNREEFWQYCAEIVKELGSYPINEIMLFGAGFIRDQFCFCDRCRNEFAPLVDQEPNRLSYGYIIENPEYHKKWHEWRTKKVHQGIAYLQSAAREIDEAAGREKPLKIAVEVLMDPETGLTEGATGEYGYNFSEIKDLTGEILINLYPFSPILPQPDTQEYSNLIEALYFTNEFKRRGGRASLFRWGIETSEQLQELKRIGKDAGIDRFVTTLSYPQDYAVRREAAIGITRS
jgi:hypothetical protein